jgi:hypothetical protein
MNSDFDLHDAILGGGIAFIGLGVWDVYGKGYAGIAVGLALLLIGVIVLLKGSS